MNREDIVRMAQETGVTAERVRDLVNFAALVASAERRNCVDTLSFHGEMSKDDDPEWAEVAFWCCSRINNPIPTDKTFAINYKQIDNSRRQA